MISTGDARKLLCRTLDRIETSTRRVFRFSGTKGSRMPATPYPLREQSLPTRQRTWLSAILLFSVATACNSGQSLDEKSADQLAAEIEAVAELKPEPDESERPIQLVPLKRADLQQLGLGPAACFLFRGDKIYLATSGEHALLRINGRPTHVLAGGPVGSTGGFFTARDVRVSIGRTGKYAGRAEDHVPGWLAEVAVRAGPDAMPQYAIAHWTCRRRKAL